MPRMKMDDIDKFFEYGVSIPTRTIYMGSMEGGDDESGVDSSMAEYAVKGLHILDNYGCSTSNSNPITVILNTLGGWVHHGMCIYDAVKDCKNHVTIIAHGSVMSMGSIILQAADHRVMMPNATMMIHYGITAMSEQHAPTVYKWLEENKKHDVWMEDLFLEAIRVKHPKFTHKKLKEWLMTDTYFSAEEAVKWGLADEVKQ